MEVHTARSASRAASLTARCRNAPASAPRHSLGSSSRDKHYRAGGGSYPPADLAAGRAVAGRRAAGPALRGRLGKRRRHERAAAPVAARALRHAPFAPLSSDAATPSPSLGGGDRALSPSRRQLRWYWAFDMPGSGWSSTPVVSYGRCVRAAARPCSSTVVSTSGASQWAHLLRFCAQTGGSDERQPFWQTLRRVEDAYRVAAFANLLLFLRGGRRAIVRAVYPRAAGRRSPTSSAAPCVAGTEACQSACFACGSCRPRRARCGS